MAEQVKYPKMVKFFPKMVFYKILTCYNTLIQKGGLDFLKGKCMSFREQVRLALTLEGIMMIEAAYKFGQHLCKQKTAVYPRGAF